MASGRRSPVNTSLQTINATNAMSETLAGTIQIPLLRKIDRGSVAFSATLTKWCADSRTIPAATSAVSAARDGMNHQDFVLLTGDFLNAFTRGHVKRLRAGLGLIFRDHPVHFVHVGGGRIVFEKCGIAAR